MSRVYLVSGSFKPEVRHPEQLISRVVVIVKDLKLQPQFLFMWTHLESDFEDDIRIEAKIVLCNTVY